MRRERFRRKRITGGLDCAGRFGDKLCLETDHGVDDPFLARLAEEVTLLGELVAVFASEADGVALGSAVQATFETIGVEGAGVGDGSRT